MKQSLWLRIRAWWIQFKCFHKYIDHAGDNKLQFCTKCIKIIPKIFRSKKAESK